MTAPTAPTSACSLPSGCACGDRALLAACGGGGGGGDDTLVGYRIEPLRNVGTFTVVAASAGDEPFLIRADPGRLLVVFLGFTNRPDACPTARRSPPGHRPTRRRR
ncbi:MAG: hypothetical protein R2710_20905 [Acidimicrobiales bacterium]